MNVARIRDVKLPAFREGYRRRFGKDPSDNACILGISTALHETAAGDAWKGPDEILDTQDDEHNWGATTLRGLRAHEQWLLGASALMRVYDAKLELRGDRLAFNRFRYSWQILDTSTEPDVASMQRDLGVTVDDRAGPKTMAALADQYPGADPAQYWPRVKQAFALNPAELEAVRAIHPSVAQGHAARASEAMRALREGLGADQLPRGVIHCDSTPKDGAYFVWFASFGNDADGAEYYLGILARTSAERAALESGDPHQLASAMYDASYFLGFHVPDKLYEIGGRQVTGAQANIDDYAAGISRHTASVRAAL